MQKFALAAALSFALAAPAVATTDLARTHEVIATPPGKMHAIAYRPIAPKPCVAARDNNPSGSRLATTVATGTADCSNERQARDYAKR